MTDDPLVSFCNSVLKLDDDIRYCCVTDEKGSILGSVMKQGLRPLDPPEDWQSSTKRRVGIVDTWSKLAPHYGRTKFLIGESDRLLIGLFPSESGIVVITAFPTLSLGKIRELRNFIIQGSERK